MQICSAEKADRANRRQVCARAGEKRAFSLLCTASLNGRSSCEEHLGGRFSAIGARWNSLSDAVENAAQVVQWTVAGGDTHRTGRAIRGLGQCADGRRYCVQVLLVRCVVVARRRR